jgi:hypothetical protein
MLLQLLNDIGDGVIQLPDFQRGWVWNDDHIRSLLASISLSHPIGAVMLLEAGNSSVRFKPRLIEGVRLPAPPKPAKLILDGQQRLTSLWLALLSEDPVPTKTEKNEEVQRFYYLDMARCLDPEGDRVDAVVSVPADRVVRSDFGRRVELDVTSVASWKSLSGRWRRRALSSGRSAFLG